MMSKGLRVTLRGFRRISWLDVPFIYTKEQVEKLKSLKKSDGRLRAHWPRC
jgi:hypothetical protein